MQYTILDLEWNGIYSDKLNGYFNEIIQFGAVRLDENLQKTGEFSTFVQPSEGKKLTGLVRQLTNITNDDLRTGVPFLEALEAFRAFSAKSVLLTWGTCDMRELVHNYRFHAESSVLPLRNLYGDLQNYCQTAMGEPTSQQLGLANAAEKLGISCQEMALHRAIDDSILSAACFAKVFDAARLQGQLIPITPDFCERMVFRAQYLTDLENPLIDRGKMKFRCPGCGGSLSQTAEWVVHNKQFNARFLCPACQKNFNAHVQYKQRYDDIQVRRRIMEDAPKEQTEAADEHSAV